MKLKTIWTIPGMTKKERFRRTREWAAQVVATKLPLRIRYWATVSEITKATMDLPGDVMATRLDEVLQNLDYPI